MKKYLFVTATILSVMGSAYLLLIILMNKPYGELKYTISIQNGKNIGNIIMNVRFDYWPIEFGRKSGLRFYRRSEGDYQVIDCPLLTKHIGGDTGVLLFERVGLIRGINYMSLGHDIVIGKMESDSPVMTIAYNWSNTYILRRNK